MCAPKRRCPDGSRCVVPLDCKSDVCISSVCLREHTIVSSRAWIIVSIPAAHCQNSKHDHGESAVNCGGPCAPGSKCADYLACSASSDCASDACISRICLREIFFRARQSQLCSGCSSRSLQQWCTGCWRNRHGLRRFMCRGEKMFRLRVLCYVERLSEWCVHLEYVFT